MIRCVLFDRDGTLGSLKDIRYPDTFVPFCDIKEVFDKIKAAGFYVGILTNQSCIARGTDNGHDFDAEFASYGADIWEICPHDVDDGCDCRKPKSGLLLRAAQKLHVETTECVYVGDRMTDVQCALNVGATPVLVTIRPEIPLADEEKRTLDRLHVTVLHRFDEILPLLEDFRARS